MSRHHAEQSSARWEQTRRAILERDGYRCQQCGTARKLQVDHIEPVHRGGDFWHHDNLQVLCADCHAVKTTGERREEMPDDKRAWEELFAERWG